jgi:hypothetical protein
MLNVPDELPSGMTIEPGTVAAPLLLDRFTKMPPAGAGFTSVTVPVEGLPPVTVLGFTVRPAIWPLPGPGPLGGLIVKFAEELFDEVAVIVATVG